MKKGFLHIIEILLVTLLMFIVISQFTYIPSIRSNWPRTKLYLQGNDIILSLDKKGIDWSNASRVQEHIESLLPQNVEYDLRFKNVIKHDIRVGCLCNDTEYGDIYDALTSPSDFTINGRKITFFPEQIDPSDPVFSVRQDVIIMREHALDRLMGNPDYSNRLETYLSSDRGVIEIADLNNTELMDFPFQKQLFNLNFTPTLIPDNNDIRFSTTFGEYSLKPTIEKYFYHFPNSSGEFYDKPHYFSNFLANIERVYPDDDIREKIILRQMTSGTPVPAGIINYNVADNMGRTVWLSETDSFSADYAVLLKAITTWAAGDSHDIATGFFQEGESVSFSFFKLLNEDMYQPIEILLTVGYRFTYEA